MPFEELDLVKLESRGGRGRDYDGTSQVYPEWLCLGVTVGGREWEIACVSEEGRETRALGGRQGLRVGHS